MTILTELQRATLEVVNKRSLKNPITGKEIANEIGLKPRSSGKKGADMRSIINALRVKGYPICAHGNGYYWAKDKAELKMFIDGFQARIDKQQVACDGLNEAFDKVGGELPEEAEKIHMYAVEKEGIVKFFSVRDTDKERFLRQYPQAIKE